MTEEKKLTLDLPEKPGTPHANLLFDTESPLGINMILHPWKGDESIRKISRMVSDFLASGEPWFEFESPHDGQHHRLSRRVVEKISVIAHARTMGETEPHSDKFHLRRGAPILIPDGFPTSRQP